MRGKGLLMLLGPEAKVPERDSPDRPSNNGSEDLRGKVAARALRRALQADASDGAILAAFKELFTHCAEQYETESEGEDGEEGV